MRVRFNVDNGANVHSCRSSVLDTEKDLGLEPGEWEAMSEDDKYQQVYDWAQNHLEYYYEEL